MSSGEKGGRAVLGATVAIALGLVILCSFGKLSIVLTAILIALVIVAGSGLIVYFNRKGARN